MFEYKLGDQIFTIEQIQGAAQKSNMSVEDYIQKAGIVKTDTTKIQPLTEETEEIKKAKDIKSEGLELFKVTEEQEIELKNILSEQAESMFVPEDQFEKKITGINNRGQAITKTVRPKNYDQYISRARKRLGDGEFKQEDIFKAAKEIYVEDGLKNEFSKRVEEAIKYDNVKASKPRTLDPQQQSFRGYPTISRQRDETVAFQEEQLEASKTLREAAKKDLDILSNNLDVYTKEIAKLTERQQELMNGAYYSEDEVNQAVEKSKNIQLQKKAIADSYVKAYDELIEKAESLEDEELLIDVLKRSYKLSDALPTKALASTAGIAAGILKIPQWLVDVTTVDGFGGGKMTLAGGGLGKALAEDLATYGEGFKKLEDSLRGMVEKPMDVSDIKNLRDIGSWSVDLIGNQAPIMATLYFYPQAGLEILSASAAGTKYDEMIKDEYTSGKEYSNLELFAGPALVALGEYGSEYITAGQLGKVRSIISKNESVLQAARQYVTNQIQKQGLLTAAGDVAAESGSEGLAKLSENIVDIFILNKDINIWEGVPNALASGGFMSGMVYKAPLYGAKMLAPFMDETTKAKLGGNLAMMDAIIQETLDPNIKPETKKQLEDQFKILLENNNMLLSKKFKEIDDLNFDELGAERKQEILDIEARRYQLNAEYSNIILDENLDTPTRNKLTEPLRIEFEELSKRKDEIFSQAKNTKQRLLNNPYKDLSEQEASELLDKDIEKANSIVKELGLGDKVVITPVKNQKEIADNLESLKENASEESKETIDKAIAKVNSQQNNGLLVDLDGVSNIYINKTNAVKGRKVDVARHELLHALLRTSFKNDSKLQIEAGNQLLTFINAFITKDKKLRETFFGNKFKEYYDLYKSGNYDAGVMMEEVLPMLSDALQRGDIQYNPTFLNKIGDFTRQSLQRVGMSEISFDKPSDVFKFIVDYNKNYNNSSFGKAFKSFAHNGISGRIKINSTNVQNIFDDLDRLNDLNEQVDGLVGPKDEDGNYTVTAKEWRSKGLAKAYQQLVIGNQIDALIARGFVGQVYGQSIQNFIHDIKYNVKDGLTDILMKFDPAKNNSLIAYINSQLQFARMKVAEQYRIELANKTSMTPELERSLAFKMEEGDTDVVQNEVDRQKKLIDASDLIPGAQEEFNSKIGDLDIVGLYFKSVPNLVSKSLADLLNVKENKILNPQDNLSTQELQNIQDYVYKNIDTIMKLMPLAYIKEAASIEFMDKSTGVPSSLLKLMYEKVDGKWEKKQDIDKNEVLAGFGINADGTKVENLSPRGTEGQRAKAIISLLGKLATNIKLRQHAKELNLSKQQILDIQAGKSPLMYSLDETRSRRADNNEHQAVVDTLFFFEKEIDDLYLNGNVSLEDGIKLLVKKGLNEKQATDLHNALSKYDPRENKQRLKDGGFTKSFMSSIDYIHYNYERAIKEQLDLVGVDIAESMGGKAGFRNELLAQFFMPMFKLNPLGKGVYMAPVEEVFYGSTESGAINLMRFIYHHFYRQGNEVQTIDGKKHYIDKKAVPALFEDNKSFVDFFNRTAINNQSPTYRFKAEVNKDGLVEISIKEHLIKEKSDKAFNTVFNLKDKRYDPRAGQMYEVDEFHNGNKDEQDLIASYQKSEQKARKDIKNFLSLLDIVKDHTLDQGLYKNQELFNRNAIAGLLINMLYNNSGAFNYMYSIKGITRNENAPRNIERSNANLYYKLKKDVPTSTFANMISLFLTDKTFGFSDVIDAMQGFTASYVPSSEIKMQPTPEQLNEIEQERRRNIKTEAKENERRMSGKVDPVTDQQKATEDRLNRIEDKVSTLISSLGPKKKVRTTTKVEAVTSKGDVVSEAIPITKEVNVIPVGNQQEFTKSEADAIYNKSVKDKQRAKAPIDPQIADYDSLISALYRKGKLGLKDKEFLFETIKRPYIQADLKLNEARQRVSSAFRDLQAKKKNVFNKLDDKSGILDFSNEDVVRIFLYNKAGHDPVDYGLTQEIVDFVVSSIKDKSNSDLYGLAKDLIQIYPSNQNIWAKPGSNWQNKNIKLELNNAVEKELRGEIFSDWVDIKNAAFSKNNMNKLRALYGPKYTNALYDILDRMETNRIRSSRLADWEERLIDFTRGGVSNVMFWNGRSAALQLISFANYIDMVNNNPYEASISLGNREQYLKDWKAIFQSDYLKDRRGGMNTDIPQAELQRIYEEKSTVGLYKWFMKNGFALTQLGDSIAIATGGAMYLGTMRRKYSQFLDSLPESFSKGQPTSNQDIIDEIYDKTYVTNKGQEYKDNNGKIIDEKGQAIDARLFLKDKKFKVKYVKKNRQQYNDTYNKLIEDLAFIDFYEKTEESQQSARPDRLSLEQTSTFGRLILAFQNTPMQYNRIILKAVSDIRNKRGNKREHLARIAYYGFVQNMFFSSLQSGLLAQMYTREDDEDILEQEKLMDKINMSLVNSVSTILRGFGIKGSIAYTLLELGFKGAKLGSKDAGIYDVVDFITAFTSFSPPLNIKARTLKNIGYDVYFGGKSDFALQKRMYDKMLSEFSKGEITSGIRHGLYNPALDMAADAASMGNFHFNRILKKLRNISEALNEQESYVQNFAFLAGWDGWSLGVEPEELEKQKKVLKGIKKYESSKKRKKLIIR